MADNLNATIGDEQFKGDLKQTLADARRTAQSAAEAATQIRDLAAKMQGIPEDVKAITGNVRQTLENTDSAIASAKQQIDATGSNLNGVTVQLAGNLQRLDRVLADVQDISGKINDGKGTAGAPLERRPAVPGVY